MANIPNYYPTNYKTQYYIDTIEQVVNDDGTYSEYGSREKVSSDTAAFLKYYTKLANVSTDLGKKHTYMHIQIVNSLGVEVKKESIGTYVFEKIEQNNGGN